MELLLLTLVTSDFLSSGLHVYMCIILDNVVNIPAQTTFNVDPVDGSTESIATEV